MLPPIDVMFDGADYWLFDGYHRMEAWEQARGRGCAVDVRIHQGTQVDAQWASYAANKAHGLRRTNEDKQRAVLAALRHPNGAGRANREIARHLGVDEGTVREHRSKLESTAEIPQLERRVGSDGRVRSIKNMGKGQNARKIGTGQAAVVTLPPIDMPAPAQYAAEKVSVAQVEAMIAAVEVDGDRPLPEWVTASPVDMRVSKASRLINIYRQAMDVADEYGELTGCFSETLAPARELNKMIKRLQRLIDVLEGRAVEPMEDCD
jgi:transposase-like protein